MCINIPLPLPLFLPLQFSVVDMVAASTSNSIPTFGEAQNSPSSSTNVASHGTPSSVLLLRVCYLCASQQIKYQVQFMLCSFPSYYMILCMYIYKRIWLVLEKWMMI